MALVIEYRYEDGTSAGQQNMSYRTAGMTPVAAKDYAIVEAQKYMDMMPAIVEASVLTDDTETIVSRATEWQKRNG